MDEEATEHRRDSRNTRTIDIGACPRAKLEVWTHLRGQRVGPSYARTKRIAVQLLAAPQDE